MGMAHRGRLNVLINIVGKSYQELFGEFEGNLDPSSVQGSGDVKYHKGFRGKFRSRSGNELDVFLASNPSHLEAVGPVVEGMARALQDQVAANAGPGSCTRWLPHDLVLPVLVHGDAAFAGQGVVAETLNMSALAGVRDRGHRAPGHQQPAWLYHQPRVGPVVGLRDRRGQDGPGAHFPCQRRRPRGVRPGGPSGVWLSARSSTRTSSSTWSATGATATTSRTTRRSPSRCSTS